MSERGHRPEQQEVVAHGEREILRVAKAIRARQTKARLAARMERHATLAMSVPLPERRYPLVLVDPPWRFQPYSRETGLDRAADIHYPTLTTDDIKALKIPAADDAVLYLWSTVPILPQALAVLAAWGFSYRSHLIWAKDRIGTGFWVRNKHELLLIGARGDIPAPAPSTRPESIIEAPVGRHSEKPAAAYELIERMYPALPKIELFARAKREGWDAWGNEAPAAEQYDDLAIPEFLRRGAP